MLCFAVGMIGDWFSWDCNVGTGYKTQMCICSVLLMVETINPACTAATPLTPLSENGRT